MHAVLKQQFVCHMCWLQAKMFFFFNTTPFSIKVVVHKSLCRWVLTLFQAGVISLQILYDYFQWGHSYFICSDSDRVDYYRSSFLPRDAMRKRGLCCGQVSIPLSVTFVHSIQTAEDIIKLLFRPGSPITLVFWPHALIPNSKGNPFSGVQITRGWDNFAIFNGNHRLSWKRYEIGPWLLWNVNRKSYVHYRMVTFSVTLTDPYPGFKVTAYLKWNIKNGAP